MDITKVPIAEYKYYSFMEPEDVEAQVWLSVARYVANESTCIRRAYGVVVVNNGELIAKGHNGNYDDCHRDCIGEGTCPRDLNNIGDDEIFNPCLREELGIGVTADQLKGAVIYIVAYDKRTSSIVAMPIDKDCIEHMESLGVEEIVQGIASN